MKRMNNEGSRVIRVFHSWSAPCLHQLWSDAPSGALPSELQMLLTSLDKATALNADRRRHRSTGFR